MRKVLFIAYHFPPIGGSGVQRSVKFVKYLPQFGWQPYVIATDRDEEQGVDTSLVADIPMGVSVWRVPAPRPQPVQRLAKLVRWQPAPGPVFSATFDPAVTSSDSVGTSFVRRLRRLALSPLSLIQTPPVDNNLYWSLRIVSLARRIIREEGIDAILTTAPPWSPTLTGALLQALTGRPWIADFRDPWTDNSYVYQSTGIRRRIDQNVERAVLKRARAIISVTDPVLSKLRKKTPSRNPGKPYVTIPNGFDRDDFIGKYTDDDKVVARDRQSITFLHPGQAYQGVSLPILLALQRMQPTHDIIERLRFHFVGYMHPRDRQSIQASSFSSLFQLDLERVSHPTAIGLMKSSHVLLLLLRGAPEASSGKVYEYMMTGVPVLALAAGVGAGLVRRSGIGCAIDPDDIESLTEILSQIALDYDGFRAQYYQPRWDVINEYDRRVLARELAGVLDHVMDQANQ
jgi:glycosyltransferase involved in cell wall biosynthesis